MLRTVDQPGEDPFDGKAVNGGLDTRVSHLVSGCRAIGWQHTREFEDAQVNFGGQLSWTFRWELQAEA